MGNNARLEKLQVYHWDSSVSFSDLIYPVYYFYSVFDMEESIYNFDDKLIIIIK